MTSRSKTEEERIIEDSVSRAADDRMTDFVEGRHPQGEGELRIVRTVEINSVIRVEVHPVRRVEEDFKET